MIWKFSIAILSVIALSSSGRAQEKDAPTPVQIRAVLQNPAHLTAKLFYPDKAGVIVPLNFRPQDLTEALLTLPVNGSLVLYDKAEVDPENPAASLAASAKIPPDLRKAIVVVLPGPEGQKPAYRMLVIDESQKSFPKGESRVIPLISVEAAIQAGEHRLPIHPGEITKVPPVRKVNEFSMAQTNFYYQQGEVWIAFAERQLQYADASRRLFIVHATPGALTPTVTTIVDTLPVAVP